MTLTTLMVQLRPAEPSVGLMRVVADVAERHRASVIGVAVVPPLQNINRKEDYAIYGDMIQRYQASAKLQFEAAEAVFRTGLQGRAADVEWRPAMTESGTRYLVDEARGADLVVTGVDRRDWGLDRPGNVDSVKIALQAGRPVLVVPTWMEHGNFDRVMISWKDSPESRRAIAGALPVLKLASHVALVEVGQPEELPAARARLQDVAAWLKKHGVAAETIASQANGDAAGRLAAIVQEQQADLIVSGAYGQSRWYERAFGDVTRNLMLRAERCALVSH
jgi:nucleotide-binding universal stress UspA family protein